MKFLTPQDGSQLTLMALKIKSGKSGAEVYEAAAIKGQFAREVAKALVGRTASPEARRAAQVLIRHAHAK
jgi:hypothetical protein